MKQNPELDHSDEKLIFVPFWLRRLMEVEGFGFGSAKFLAYIQEFNDLAEMYADPAKLNERG